MICILKMFLKLSQECRPRKCTDHGYFGFASFQVLLKGSSLQFGQFEDSDPADNPEGFMGVGDNDWDEWEEWMGWEGAGTYDYSNHVNVNL